MKDKFVKGYVVRPDFAAGERVSTPVFEPGDGIPICPDCLKDSDDLMEPQEGIIKLLTPGMNTFCRRCNKELEEVHES